MSGFVALVHGDGRPVDRGEVEALTAAMAYRGPDRQSVEVAGEAGLGHALLDTGGVETAQPAVLRGDGGELWIVADARLDDRQTLIRRLASAADEVAGTVADGTVADGTADEVAGTSDAGLLLRAYRAWGAASVDHLLGDFAFVVWDRRRRLVFGARDPLGVKPFYYLPGPRGGLLVGNTLEVLRRHRWLSGRLDDRAIADFLLFGGNLDLATTAFDGLRRLPPGHLFRWRVGEGVPRPRRYFRLEPPARWQGARPGEVVERFRSVLRWAVADRLPPGPATLLLSGGMDSASIAAFAADVLGDERRRLRATTLVYRRQIPDREGEYAAEVAAHLGIPIDLHPADDYRRFQAWGLDRPPFPEPVDENLWALSADVYPRIAGHGRVALGGHGGDPALLHPPGYLWRQLRRLRLGRVLAYLRATQRLRWRLPPAGLRTRLRAARLRRRVDDLFPPWLAPELVRRLDLRSRWREVMLRDDPAARGEPAPDRPAEVCRLLADPSWVQLFETDDPGFSRFPVEHRHPFFDLRLLRLVLSLPPVPWFVDKALLREATEDMLPRTITRRPKAPLAGVPHHGLERSPGEERRRLRFANRWIVRYLQWDAVCQRLEGRMDEPSIRALSLAYWLAGLAAESAEGV
jgi:asparagine synthase (glutamine-hydrolysing)